MKNMLETELKNSFFVLETLFAEEDLSLFRQAPAKDVKNYRYHCGLMVRLKLLGKGSRLYKAFVSEGILNREIMVERILLAFYMHLQEQPYSCLPEDIPNMERAL